MKRIIDLVKTLNRPGMEAVVDYIENSNYATARCHAHHCYKGGLADHSIEVYEHMKREHANDMPEESIIICSLFHDICKCCFYKTDYRNVKENVKDLDLHLEDIKKQILSFKHQQFLRFEEQFQKELSEGLSEIKKQQQVIEEYQEERTYLLYEANSDKVKEIDIQIHNKPWYKAYRNLELSEEVKPVMYIKFMAVCILCMGVFGMKIFLNRWNRR